ncbi:MULTISPECIES: hypothetical protein [Providencia]|uniref:hypothetical protein n=1 Tax=Providencia TaxID=586 RepID=UPI001B396CD3|nr:MULTISPECIES: hypothetical protein [Providencia]MBQ0531905.1 hypothetical protein [Providencia rettgeri]WOB85473.1 hypothetical protein P3L40_17815 [Providencia sp. PROV040]
MDTIYSLLILFVLYCIISDWFMHEYGEKLNSDNFYKFKIGSFFFYQVKALKPLKMLVNLNDNNLAKQPIFWIGITAPLIIAGWVEYQIIILNPDLLSFEKIEDFFKASSAAIYISALIPTLGVIIANIHRTIQTEEQIKKTEKQITIAKDQFIIARKKNNLDLFYSHYKYVIEKISEINIKKTISYKEIKEFFKELVGSKYVGYLDSDLKISFKIDNKISLYGEIFYKDKNNEDFDIKLEHIFVKRLDSEVKKMSVLLNDFNLKVKYINSGSPLIILYSNDDDFSIYNHLESIVSKLEDLFYLLKVDVNYDFPKLKNFIYTNKAFISLDLDETKYKCQEYYSKDYEYYAESSILLMKIHLELSELIEITNYLIEEIYKIITTDSVYDPSLDSELDSILSSDEFEWLNSNFSQFSDNYYLSKTFND